jgi:peptidoglycan/LPS O-acetylase OafA/YrhL
MEERISLATAPKQIEVIFQEGARVSSAPAYRPDIDGLRAIAIISVLLYHAFPNVLPGGFVGVDIFFVISGFLISGIIVRSLQNGRFSYANFYQRRIKRIFPSLSVVLLASLVVGWMFLLPDEFRELGRNVFAGSAFSSNLYMLRGKSYFQAEANPLLHLWSLGIEEQFYLAWPLVLCLLWKRRSSLMPILSLLLVGSFVLDVSFIHLRPTTVFYFPGTRFWELESGGLAAYLVASRRMPAERTSGDRVAGVLSFCGFALLVASTLIVDWRRPFPGIWAALPIAGALFAIAAGPNAWINRLVLSSRPMVFVGLISYPLYLWHWPLLFYARLLRWNGYKWWISVIAILISVGLAYFTYKFVESPLRHHPSWKVPWVLLAGVAALGIVGLLDGRITPRLHGTPVQETVAATQDWNYPFGINFGRLGKSTEYHGALVGSSSDAKVMFWGDSHMEQYYSRIKFLEDHNQGKIAPAFFVTKAGCPPLRYFDRFIAGYNCPAFFEFALASARRPDIKTVVIGGYWEMYLGHAVASDSARGVASRLPDRAPQQEASLVDLALADIGEVIRSLRAQGKQVYVLLSNPESDFLDPKNNISRFTGFPSSRAADRILMESNPVRIKLMATVKNSGAEIIDPLPDLCGSSTCQATSADGTPSYKDSNHLRSSYIAEHAKFIDRVFELSTVATPH